MAALDPINRDALKKPRKKGILKMQLRLAFTLASPRGQRMRQPAPLFRGVPNLSQVYTGKFHEPTSLATFQ